MTKKKITNLEDKDEEIRANRLTGEKIQEILKFNSSKAGTI